MTMKEQAPGLDMRSKTVLEGSRSGGASLVTGATSRLRNKPGIDMRRRDRKFSSGGLGLCGSSALIRLIILQFSHVCLRLDLSDSTSRLQK